MGVGAEREKIFDSLAWWLHRHGVRPDHITFLQVPVYLAMVYTGYESYRSFRDLQIVHWGFMWGFLLLSGLGFLIDGADGILARRTGSVTRQGHLLDALFDIGGIGISIWVVYLHYPHLGAWLLALLLVNFFVYVQNEIQGTKSITYTRGPLLLGFLLEPAYPGLLEVGLWLPLFIGTVLIFTRVAWRKRFWTYYQYFTAGLRHEYKATPREQRAQLASNPRMNPPALHAGAPMDGRAEAGGDGRETPRKREESPEQAP